MMKPIQRSVKLLLGTGCLVLASLSSVIAAAPQDTIPSKHQAALIEMRSSRIGRHPKCRQGRRGGRRLPVGC